MRLIKSFRVFESNYNFEEFVDVITRELLKYNLDNEKLRTIIYQKEEDINFAIQNGENPLIFSKELIKELELDKAYNIGRSFPYSIGGTIKYL